MSRVDENFAHTVLRRLKVSDYDRGFLALLNELTDVGTVTRKQFEQRVLDMQACSTTFVIEDISLGTIIATGTLLIERKFIHSCCVVGHIEDFVVAKTHRGKLFGTRIMQALKSAANEAKCRKLLLDCSLENVAFYEKLGFRQKERQMVLYPERKENG